MLALSSLLRALRARHEHVFRVGRGRCPRHVSIERPALTLRRRLASGAIFVGRVSPIRNDSTRSTHPQPSKELQLVRRKTQASSSEARTTPRWLWCGPLGIAGSGSEAEQLVPSGHSLCAELDAQLKEDPPVKLAMDGRRGRKPMKFTASQESHGKPWRTVWRSLPISDRARTSETLNGILTAYLHSVRSATALKQDQEQQEEDDNAGVFSKTRCDTLERHGYTPEDVVSWAWIAGSGTADLATKRLLSLTKELVVHERNLVPSFVPLQILLRQDLDATGLNILLQDVQLRVPQQPRKRTPKDIAWTVWDLDIAMLYLARLARHSRKLAPATLNEVALLACSILHNGAGGKTQLEPNRLSSLCIAFNRTLSLLSLPASATPFRSMRWQQQAQFTLLRGMLEFSPHIPVTREGYRAMVKTQIAHRKTDPERQWASAQSQSWPPWQESRLGIDEGIDYPGKESRAITVLSRMGEAGYKFFNWDLAAKILAGWDTDKSPTIQTRSLIERGKQFWAGTSPSSKETPKTEPEAVIWAARIRSTRTIREAWASFCSFKSLKSQENHFDVYVALFERLLAPKKETNVDSKALPGDGKELRPEPASSRDYLYVPTNPPSVEQLYDQMLADGMKPAGRLLAILLDSAASIDVGIKYIQDSTLGEVKQDVLLKADKYDSTHTREVLEHLPGYLLAAYMRLLLRHNSTRKGQFNSPGSAFVSQGHGKPVEVSASTYAWQMLRVSQIRYIPVWNAFLAWEHQDLNSCLNGRGTHAQARTVRRKYKALKKILFHMRARGVRADFGTLADVIPVLSKCVLTIRRSATTLQGSAYLTMIAEALALGKGLFVEAGHGQASSALQSWLEPHYRSQLLSHPSPYMLWSMVSFCGVAQDVEGVMDLLRWMKHHEEDLVAIRGELSNGAKMLRWTLVVAKMFLEGRWAGPKSGLPSVATDDELHQLKDLVNAVPAWGGWPSDGEVDDYMQDRTKWIHRIRKAVRERHRAEVESGSTAAATRVMDGLNSSEDHGDAPGRLEGQQSESAECV